MIERMHRIALTLSATTLLALSACGLPVIPALASNSAVVLDGQTCTVGDTLLNSPFEGTNCANAEDWPRSNTNYGNAYEEVGLIERTRLAHLRPSQGPPSQQLFVAFEATGADPINNETIASFAISPTTNIDDARAYLIRPTNTTLSGSQVGQTPAEVQIFEWNGSDWAPVAGASGVEARFAYNSTLRYWGIEARVDPASAGITGDTIRLATHWKTRSPEVGGPAAAWRPQGAEATTGNQDLPVGDPSNWTEFRLQNLPTDP